MTIDLTIDNLAPGLRIPAGPRTPAGVVTHVERRPCEDHQPRPDGNGLGWLRSCPRCVIAWTTQYEGIGERHTVFSNQDLWTDAEQQDWERQPLTVPYTVSVEAADPNTPIILGHSPDLAEREVVGYRDATWQAVAPEETTYAPAGTADEVARDALRNQNVAALDGTGRVRARAWEGADPDTGADPDGEAYDEPTAIYAAHVITADAGLGDPEIIVMTDESGAADPIVSYPLPEGASPVEVLAASGWRVCGVAARDPYLIVAVEPADWVGLVRAVTGKRAAAHAELERQDTAWRRVIGDAMRVDGVARQAIADAAGVTLARTYQIRDGRR